MKNFFPSVLAGAALCATAAAGTFSVSGAGGSIPDNPGTGTWNAAPTWSVFTTTVSVNYNVTGITHVKLAALNHTWRGDIHVYLADPNGVRHNIVVRPGFTGANAGDSGDYLNGTYDFVQTGGGTVAQGATSISGGVYNQFLNAGAGMWTSGTYPISNTPMNSITGPKGTWTLTIADWVAADVGSITGWTLEGNDVSGFDTFCDPGVDALPCPCANPPSGSDRGCNNFGALSGGASITAAGNALVSGDTLVLTASNENAAAFTIFVQGSVFLGGGMPFGAGVRCVDNPLLRLYSGNAVAGAISRPSGADPSITARSAALGSPIASSDVRYYFSYYRDPGAAGPCGNAASTFNATNAGSMTWGL